MTGKLQIGPEGRVTGPVAITYNNPFPTKPQSTGQLGTIPACLHERCPLTWENGSCEASSTLVGEDTL